MELERAESFVVWREGKLNSVVLKEEKDCGQGTKEVDGP